MGKGIIDEAYQELERVRKETQETRNEHDRLIKENVRITGEIVELDKKRESIKKYLDDKEKASRDKIADLLEQAEKDVKTAMQNRAETDNVLATSKDEAKALKDKSIELDRCIAEYKALSNKYDALHSNLREVADLIISKLKG